MFLIGACCNGCIVLFVCQRRIHMCVLNDLRTMPEGKIRALNLKWGKMNVKFFHVLDKPLSLLKKYVNGDYFTR